MIYTGNHYGPEWFITKDNKTKKGFYIRFSSDPLEYPRIEIYKTEMLEIGDWEKAKERDIRFLIKLLFKRL